MTELDYRQALDFFKQEGSLDALQSTLFVFGEPYLRKRIIDAVVDRLLPDESKRSLCIEIIDPSEGDEISDAIEHLSTFSFFSGKKVVLLKNASLFSTGIDMDATLAKIQAGYEKKDMKAVARLFGAILSARKLTIDDVNPPGVAGALGIDLETHQDITCLDEVAQHCINEGLCGKIGQNRTQGLFGLIEKGYAPGHYLVISEDSVDRRTSVFKHIKSAGLVINCSVPAGDRKADREAQRNILSSLVAERLGRAGKRMDSMAFNHCLDLTGYNIHVFMANIDKLIDYTGNRPAITREDVNDALTRSRKDPIYEFTGAIAEKKTDTALFYLYSLIDEGYHYLQLFAAIVNNVRKLLLFRGFIDSGYNKNWRPGVSYDRFRSTVLPDIIEYDGAVKNAAERQYVPAQAENETKKKKGVPKACADILLVKNPKNAYPIYSQLKNADRFTTPELEQVVIRLSEADIRLKKSSQNPVTVIESLIFAICRPRISR